MADEQAEATEGQETTPSDLQDSCSENRTPELPGWAEQAWRLYCRGQRNWTALGRQFGVDYRTVKANVRKFGELVRAATSGSGVDAWQEAVTAQEEILSEAWRIHTASNATNQEKTAALKLAQDAVEKVAALKGVVTKREAREHGGTVKVEHGIDVLSMLKDPEARKLAADLSARLAGEVVTGSGAEGLDEATEGELSEALAGDVGMGAD
jgi:transposase-like protein